MNDAPPPSASPIAWRCLWPAAAQLGEGALWSPRLQALWWVDILGRSLHLCEPDGTLRQRWTFDEEVSAVAECADDGGLLLALRHGFARFDPFTPGSVPRTLHRPAGEPAGNRFNDGKCDAQGRFWAGSMDFDAQAPTGALYRCDTDGRCTVQDQGFPVCNGPTWSLDGRTLYFNDTVGGRTLAYEVNDAGELRGRRVWRQWDAATEGVPDGMTTDAAGRLWIAHWGGGCVSCHDPASGQELQRIALPVTQVTSCAFGGADLRTLYITSAAVGLDDAARAAQPLAGALFAAELDTPGLPAHRYGASRA